MAPVQDGTDYFGYVYGALTVVGGAIGYLNKGSLASLVSGLISGGLLLYGATLTTKSYNNARVIFWTSLVLFLFFAKRFYSGRKFMPGGLMTILSLVAVVNYGRRVFS